MRIYPFNIQLDKVILKNFRGFKSLNLDIDPKLTVLISENGGGKTSILDAIAKYLMRIERQFIREIDYDPKKIFSAYDVHNNVSVTESENTLGITLTYWELTDEILEEGGKQKWIEKWVETEQKLEDFSFSFSKSGNLYDRMSKETFTILYNAFATNIQLIFNFSEENKSEKEEIQHFIALPILAYYPLARFTDLENGKLKPLSNHIFDTYYRSLTKTSINFERFRQWYEWQYKINIEVGGGKLCATGC